MTKNDTHIIRKLFGGRAYSLRVDFPENSLAILYNVSQEKKILLSAKMISRAAIFLRPRKVECQWREDRRQKEDRHWQVHERKQATGHASRSGTFLRVIRPLPGDLCYFHRVNSLVANARARGQNDKTIQSNRWWESESNPGPEKS